MSLLGATEGITGHGHESLDGANLISFNEFTANKTLALA
jgi:hypothetical protein